MRSPCFSYAIPARSRVLQRHQPPLRSTGTSNSLGDHLVIRSQSPTLLDGPFARLDILGVIPLFKVDRYTSSISIISARAEEDSPAKLVKNVTSFGDLSHASLNA
jgi:hypothetical protein